MKGLNKRDLFDVLSLQRGALECSQVDELQTKVIQNLENIFNPQDVFFYLAHPSEQRIDFNRGVWAYGDENLVTQYYKYYYKLDPLFDKYFSLNRDVFCIEEVISIQYLLSTEYYNDYLTPSSAHYIMYVVLRSVRKPLALIGMCRSRGETNFSFQERAKAKLLSSYLSAVLEKNIILNEIRKREFVLSSITEDVLNKGIIVLNDSLELIYMNKIASNIISTLFQEAECKENPSCIPQFLYQCCKNFRESINLKESPETHQQQSNQVTYCSKQPILVSLSFLNPDDKIPLFLILLEPNKIMLFLYPNLKKIGLTPREVEVINFLCQGLTNKEIADRLFVSEHTIKNHLFNIFEKIGVKNRTSLVEKVIHLTT